MNEREIGSASISALREANIRAHDAEVELSEVKMYARRLVSTIHGCKQNWKNGGVMEGWDAVIDAKEYLESMVGIESPDGTEQEPPEFPPLGVSRDRAPTAESTGDVEREEMHKAQQSNNESFNAIVDNAALSASPVMSTPPQPPDDLTQAALKCAQDIYDWSSTENARIDEDDFVRYAGRVIALLTSAPAAESTGDVDNDTGYATGSAEWQLARFGRLLGHRGVGGALEIVLQTGPNSWVAEAAETCPTPKPMGTPPQPPDDLGAGDAWKDVTELFDALIVNFGMTIPVAKFERAKKVAATVVERAAQAAVRGERERLFNAMQEMGDGPLTETIGVLDRPYHLGIRRGITKCENMVLRPFEGVRNG